MLVNFEKVSKRTHLDIASVNTAIVIKVDESNITSCFNISRRSRSDSYVSKTNFSVFNRKSFK